MIKDYYWKLKFLLWNGNKRCLRCRHNMILHLLSVITKLHLSYRYEIEMGYICLKCNFLYNLDNQMFKIHKNAEDYYSFKDIQKLLKLKVYM